MKRSVFSETQIVAILKEGEAGRQVAQICRDQGISNATYYAWKSKMGGRVSDQHLVALDRQGLPDRGAFSPSVVSRRSGREGS